MKVNVVEAVMDVVRMDATQIDEKMTRQLRKEKAKDDRREELELEVDEGTSSGDGNGDSANTPVAGDASSGMRMGGCCGWTTASAAA